MNQCFKPSNMQHQTVLCTKVSTQGCTCHCVETEPLLRDPSTLLSLFLQGSGHCEIVSNCQHPILYICGLKKALLLVHSRCMCVV